jgi:putative ABC transport system substrate-binding protein
VTRPSSRRRRVLAAALALVPLAALPQARRVPRVAYIVSGPLEPSRGLGTRIETGLATQGVKAEVRMFHAESDSVEVLGTVARDAVSWQPDVIVAPGPLAAQAARAATAEIPIVFFGISDPERFGLVRSMARPGGNATGAAIQAGNITVKRLELVRDLLPKARRVTTLLRRRAGANLTPLEAVRGQLGVLASKLGIELEDADVEARGLRATLASLARRPADALVAFGPYVWDPAGLEYVDAMKLLLDFERSTRCVVIHDSQWAMEMGAVIAMYDTGSQVRVAIEMAARVLRGASPATMPVDAGTTYALAVNPAAARAIGIELPPSIMIRAEVVKG